MRCSHLACCPVAHELGSPQLGDPSQSDGLLDPVGEDAGGGEAQAQGARGGPSWARGRDRGQGSAEHARDESEKTDSGGAFPRLRGSDVPRVPVPLDSTRLAQPS